MRFGRQHGLRMRLGRRWHGRPHHRRDMQHFFFGWLVMSALATGFVAGHVGAFVRGMGLGFVGFLATVFVALSGFWFASGRIARRLSRPMEKLTAQAQAIGEGNYSGRSNLEHHRVHEVSRLAVTLNDMSARIEGQLRDQRELLAALSHELRSPLARMRVLLEMAREGQLDDEALASMEEEVQVCDRLIGTMLASARLEFKMSDRVDADALDLARRALARAGLPAELLRTDLAAASVRVDVTLVGQALSNLIENAARHGGGLTALTVSREGDAFVLAVEDAGPGIAGSDRTRLFESFYRQSDGQTQGLGLGLSLVRQVALAHGGRTFADNLSPHGARVGLSLPAS